MEQNKLETGSVGKLLVSLSIPMICAQLVTLLYKVVDRIFIGQMENGTLALAGICALVSFGGNEYTDTLYVFQHPTERTNTQCFWAAINHL